MKTYNGMTRNVRYRVENRRNWWVDGPVNVARKSVSLAFALFPVELTRSSVFPGTVRTIQQINIWEFQLLIRSKRRGGRPKVISVEMSGPKLRGRIHEGEPLRVHGFFDQNNVFQAEYVISAHSNQRIHCGRFNPTY